jgi:hypothetical protein
MKVVLSHPVISALIYSCLGISAYALLSVLLSFLNGSGGVWLSIPVIMIYFVMIFLAESIPCVAAIAVIVQGRTLLPEGSPSSRKVWLILFAIFGALTVYLLTRIVVIHLLLFISRNLGVR